MLLKGPGGICNNHRNTIVNVRNSIKIGAGGPVITKRRINSKCRKFSSREDLMGPATVIGDAIVNVDLLKKGPGPTCNNLKEKFSK